MPQTELHAKLHLRSWGKMHVGGSHAPVQARGLDFQAAISLEVCTHRSHATTQADPRIPPLPHKSRICRGFQRSQDEVVTLDATFRAELLSPRRIQFFQNLECRDAQFLRMGPPK